MSSSQDSDQQSYHYVPHIEFPDLRGFEEVPAYQNAQQPFLLFSPTEHPASQLFSLGGGVAPAPYPAAAYAYTHPVIRAASTSPNYGLLSLSPASPSPSTPFTRSLPTSPNPIQQPLPQTSPEVPRLRVPQTTRLVTVPRDTVQFEVGGSLGIRMCDVVSGHAQPDLSEDRVLEHTGHRQIHLVIMWPGYEQSGRYLHVQNDGLYITRGRLANLVSDTVRHFLRAASRKRRRHARGSQQWTIGNNGIQFQDLWLLSVVRDGNIWRPEIEAHVRGP